MAKDPAAIRVQQPKYRPMPRPDTTNNLQNINNSTLMPPGPTEKADPAEAGNMGKFK